jgi:hypothetical protein
MMAMLRRFMTLLLRSDQWLERDLTGKPGPTFPDRAQNLEFKGAQAPKKEARPKGPGTPYALRCNIVRNRRKTMVYSTTGQ